MAAALAERLLARGNERGNEYQLRRSRNFGGRWREAAAAGAEHAMNFAVRMRGRVSRRNWLVGAIQAECGAVSGIIGLRKKMAGGGAGKGDVENKQIGGEPARQPAPTRLVALVRSHDPCPSAANLSSASGMAKPLQYLRLANTLTLAPGISTSSFE